MCTTEVTWQKYLKIIAHQQIRTYIERCYEEKISVRCSRDFCYIDNVVQANLAAAQTSTPESINQVYNVAVSGRTTLNQLYQMLKQRLLPDYPHLKASEPVYRDFRPGDVRHSLADISKAGRLLGYRPTHDIEQGLDEALEWYRTSVGLNAS